MLVDDWEWDNVGYHRDLPTKEVVTPNIDNLVREGLELDQHYTFKFCSPSCSSLMSGRLPIHVDAHPDIYNPLDLISGFCRIRWICCPPNWQMRMQAWPLQTTPLLVEDLIILLDISIMPMIILRKELQDAVVTTAKV